MTGKAKEADELGAVLSTKTSFKEAQRQEQMNELLYGIKSDIDREQQYGDRMKDRASGYAAGRGISQEEAYQEISAAFGQKFGRSPHDYLQNLFDQRRMQKIAKEQNRPLEQSR